MKIVSTNVVFIFLFVAIKFFAVNGSANSKISSCPEVLIIGSFNVKSVCSKGKLFINKEHIKKIKSTDRVEVISNLLRINGEFVRYIPPLGIKKKTIVDNNWTGNHLTSRAGNCNCPAVIKIACINVSDTCINHKLYINGEHIKNVSSADKVAVVSNNLFVNDKFIHYVPPFGINASSPISASKKRSKKKTVEKQEDAEETDE